jgi:hypothetical protein
VPLENLKIPERTGIIVNRNLFPAGSPLWHTLAAVGQARAGYLKVLGYKESNDSPILKLLLSRSDELVACASKKTR